MCVGSFKEDDKLNSTKKWQVDEKGVNGNGPLNKLLQFLNNETIIFNNIYSYLIQLCVVLYFRGQLVNCRRVDAQNKYGKRVKANVVIICMSLLCVCGWPCARLTKFCCISF